MTYNAQLAWTGHTTTMAKYEFASACAHKIAQRIASVSRRNDSFVARLTAYLEALPQGEHEYINFGECSDGVWLLKAWKD